MSTNDNPTGSPLAASYDARLDALEAGGGGGGSALIVGPYVIDRSQVSGQQLFDGVRLDTLPVGMFLEDISWRVTTPFTGYGDSPAYPDAVWIPMITYLGTSEVNFTLGIEGNGWDGDPTQDITGISSLNVSEDPFDHVGDWNMPNDRVSMSILTEILSGGYIQYWSRGIFVPDTADRELIVKIKGNDNVTQDPLPVDSSTAGIVEFYIHASAVAAP
jgi:hypothetical protein